MWVWKFITAIVIIVFCIMAIKQGYQTLKEKILYKVVAKRLKNYCEKQYGAKLSISGISGNFFSNICLENIRLEKIKGFPQNFQLKARSIKLKYNLRELIKHEPRIEFFGLELNYANLKLPIKVSQQNGLIMLSFDKKYLYFSPAAEETSLEKDLIFKGLCGLQGLVILERLKPKIFNIQLESDNFELIYKETVKVKANLDFSLKSEHSIPHLIGSVVIKEAEYAGEINGVSFKDVALLGIMDNFLLDVAIKGNNLKIKNKYLDVDFNADLRFKKQPHGQLRLVGKIEPVKGRYVAYENKFKITKGKISFYETPKAEAKIDIAGETRVSGFRIFAAVRGTLKDSHLELTSRPALTRNEIMALLLFGKRISDLGVSEKMQFSDGAELTASFLNKLFLGKAEAKIAEVIGVDDLLVHTDVVSQSHGLQLPSVGVGKYFSNDKLYGIYKIKPGQIATDKPLQMAGGEYALGEHITVKGERNFSESIKLPQEDKFSIEFQWKF